MSVFEFVVACVAVFVGSCVQGSLGFGLGLIAAPVLAFVDPDLVPGPVLMLALVLTVAVASRDGFPHVDQWGTQVARAHRGHRLGMAVKCAQVRLVQQTCPDKTYLATSNSETNAPMVAINEALGFRVQAVLGDFTKRLD